MAFRHLVEFASWPPATHNKTQLTSDSREVRKFCFVQTLTRFQSFTGFQLNFAIDNDQILHFLNTLRHKELNAVNPSPYYQENQPRKNGQGKGGKIFKKPNATSRRRGSS